jgi:dTDP-D-glucose 4,6-dehydratase
MYVYTADAVRALLLLSARGAAGEAYNVANEATFCSIWEMAHMVAREFGTTTQVTRVVDEAAAGRYAVSGRIWMDTSKLSALGWQPTADLPTMYARMMADWDESASAQPERQTPPDEPAAQTAQPDRPEQPTPPVRSAVQSDQSDQPEVTTRA